MNILWIIGKIAIYTFVLNVLLRQTYNFIFFFGRMPIAWICVVAILGIANVILAYKLSWDPGIVSSAVLFALLLNWPPSIPRAPEKASAKQMVDSVYTELGISRGRIKYRLGLVLFALASAAAYVLLFAESCSLDGKCEPLMRVL